MYCDKCGKQIPEDSGFCPFCGTQQEDTSQDQPSSPPRPQPSETVPNYLVQSILVTILCCLPLGIPAIVFSAQVNGKLQSGDYAGAVESSRKAKKFCWIAFGVGLAIGILYFIIGFFGAMMDSGMY